MVSRWYRAHASQIVQLTAVVERKMDSKWPVTRTLKIESTKSMKFDLTPPRPATSTESDLQHKKKLCLTAV